MKFQQDAVSKTPDITWLFELNHFMLLDIFIITNHQNESNLTDFQQRTNLSLDQKVLLGGKDSLFSLQTR